MVRNVKLESRHKRLVISLSSLVGLRVIKSSCVFLHSNVQARGYENIAYELVSVMPYDEIINTNRTTKLFKNILVT